MAHLSEGRGRAYPKDAPLAKRTSEPGREAVLDVADERWSMRGAARGDLGEVIGAGRAHAHMGYRSWRSSERRRR
ncbi:Hypothetical protein A7982_07056 [Minicystis rosea]|nr:Hypothetical protein A7982_07056 [Minicystis rosea]